MIGMDAARRRETNGETRADTTERLASAERFTRALLASEIETSLDGVLAMQADGDIVIYNRRFAAMWGVPAGDGAASHRDSIFRRIEPQLRDPLGFRGQVGQVGERRDAAAHRELELRDERVIEVHSDRIHGPDGESLGSIWIFRDVTEQRRSERALRASHALLATTERIAHVGGWEWDVVHDTLTWSDEACRMFGRDPETFVPNLADFLSAIDPAGRGRVEQALAACIQSGHGLDIEFRIRRPDGSEGEIHARAEVLRDADGHAVRMGGTCHDVTSTKAAERELRFLNALFTAQIESSPDGILVVGTDRRIVSYNQRFTELWRIPPAVTQARSDEAALAFVAGQLKAPAAFLQRVQELYARADERADEEIELKDGRVFQRHSSPLPIAAGQGVGRIFFFRDITARKNAEERVARMARQDELTGLANRGVFVESMKQAIARSRRTGTRFALLVLDLDHFKDVNDTLGHPVGDQLLQGIAERLRGCVREHDIVARFGGDEFGVLESEVGDLAEVASLAERILATIRAPLAIQGSEVRVGASIGMTTFSPAVTVPEVLLSQADLALYRAKADGRGTYRFFAEGMDSEVRRRVALASDLRKALEDDQLFLAYQPQVELSTGRIVGLEALARWRHPTRGHVSPAEFIPVAERCGLIVPIGRFVMRTACQQAKVWLDAGIAPEIMAVNISGSQFRTPLELEGTLESVLAETGLPRERLELELTESVLMDAWLEQREVLLNLRKSGLKLAIDDFGTGFSSLQYLSRFPVDRLKIAQGFISDLTEECSEAAIVKATIGLARELHLQVIAEGVETLAQLDQLRAWGCGEAQGYYFARPMPAADLEPLLRAGFIRPMA